MGPKLVDVLEDLLLFLVVLSVIVGREKDTGRGSRRLYILGCT